MVLQANVHYIPVQSDLSDLIEKMKWAQSNDPFSKKIADQAYQFAKENLMFGDVLHYLSLVLKRYGMCQSINQHLFRRIPNGSRSSFAVK